MSQLLIWNYEKKIDMSFVILLKCFTEQLMFVLHPRKHLHLIFMPPGDFEEAEQAYAAQHWDAHCWCNVHVDKDELHNASGHNKAVKAIEERHEIWW